MTSAAYLSINEAARVAGVSRATLRRRCDRIGVRLVQSPHDRRLWLIAAADVEALVSVDAAIQRREVAA